MISRINKNYWHILKYANGYCLQASWSRECRSMLVFLILNSYHNSLQLLQLSYIIFFDTVELHNYQRAYRETKNLTEIEILVGINCGCCLHLRKMSLLFFRGFRSAYPEIIHIAGLAIWSLWNGRLAGSFQSLYKIHFFTNFAQEEDSLHWVWGYFLCYFSLMLVTLVGESREFQNLIFDFSLSPYIIYLKLLALVSVGK